MSSQELRRLFPIIITYRSGRNYERASLIVAIGASNRKTTLHHMMFMKGYVEGFQGQAYHVHAL